MEIRTGVDIVDLKRFNKTIERNRNILDKIYHRSEIALFPEHNLTGIYALKEAIFKALDFKEKNWLNIEVSYNKSGKPQVKIFDDCDILSIDCSISHDGNYAVGMVSVLVKR